MNTYIYEIQFSRSVQTAYIKLTVYVQLMVVKIGLRR